MLNPYKAHKALHSGTTPYFTAWQTLMLPVFNIILPAFKKYVNPIFWFNKKFNKDLIFSSIVDIFPLYIPLKPHNRPLSLKAFRVVLLEFSILASKISSSGMLRAVNEDILSVKFRVQRPHGKTLVFIYCHNSLLIFYFVSTLRQYCMISEISTAFLSE